MFVYDLLKKQANEEFDKDDFDRACRKYEEALSVWRYFTCSNPKWQEQGIDDDDLKEHDSFGDNEQEKSEIIKIKLACYLNIAACNLKIKEF